MMPAARLAAAIEVLDAWLAGQPAELALQRWARGARYAGSKDRAAVRDHVFDVLRRKGSCAWAGGAETGRALIIGLLRLQGIAPETVFTGEAYAPSALSEAELQALATPIAPMPDAPDVPAWLLPPLRGALGDALDPTLDAFAERAPLWLRVALRRGSVDAAAEVLRGDGIETVPDLHTDPHVTTALQVTDGARRLRAARAYADGLVEPQDLSVQRAIARLNWPEAGRILDYCAGGGGKSLALADLTDARILAHDAEPARMADLPVRAARAGVQIETVATADLPGLGVFEAVLADVPCSGSGTWRRDPEAKWRLTPARLAELTDLQDTILEAAADLVAPGGRLIYMTCSLLPVENDERIAAFCARHRDWSLVSTHLDTPVTASDGFFSAELRRTARA